MEYYKNLSLENIIYTNDEGQVCEEIWKDIPEYEGLYQVSDLGRVKSCRKKTKILKGSFFKTYRYICLCVCNNKKPNAIHVLIANVFLNHIPNGHNKIVDHINNIKTDNRLCNLQIISHRENDSKNIFNKTGELGLYLSKNGKFGASVFFDNKAYNIGVFDNKEDAIFARKKSIELYLLGKDFLSVRNKKSIDIYKCVYKKGQVFYARASFNGKTYNLGYFKTKEEGYNARLLFFKQKGLIL